MRVTKGIVRHAPASCQSYNSLTNGILPRPYILCLLAFLDRVLSTIRVLNYLLQIKFHSRLEGSLRSIQ
jgi:hypothetical protein